MFCSFCMPPTIVGQHQDFNRSNLSSVLAPCSLSAISEIEFYICLHHNHIHLTYFDRVIVTSRHKHFRISRIESDTIHNIFMSIFSQSDSIMSIPHVCLVIFCATTERFSLNHWKVFKIYETYVAR